MSHEIIVNFSIRDDANHRALTVETQIIREVAMKTLEELIEEVEGDLENSLMMCLDELGIPGDE